MKTNRVIVGLVLLLGSAALADETVSVSRAAPEKTAGLYNALEIAVGGGYSQGVGNVGSGVPSLTDSGGAGTSLELDVGWRIDPHFLVGVYGTGAWFSTGDASGNAFNNWSATAGVQGNYHFLPGESYDPWIGLGTGWRGYWVNRPEGRDSRHGIDLARLQVGVDVPVQHRDSLRPPGRPRSEQDVRDVVGCGGTRPVQRPVRGFGDDRGGAEVIGHPGEHRDTAGVRDHGVEIRGCDHRAGPLGRVLGIQRHYRGTRVTGGEQARVRLFAARRQQADPARRRIGRRDQIPGQG